MKKPFYYLVMLFAVALCIPLVFCSDDDEPDGGNSFTVPTNVQFIETMEGVWLGEQDMSFMIFTTTNWPQAFGYNRSAVKWGSSYSCVGGSMSGIPVREGDHYYLSQSSGLFNDMWITAYDGKKITMKNFKTDESKSFVFSPSAGICRVRLTEELPCGFMSSVDITVDIYVNNDDAEPDYSIALGEMNGYEGGVSAPFWAGGHKVVARFSDCTTGELLETATWADLDMNTIYNLNY